MTTIVRVSGVINAGPPGPPGEKGPPGDTAFDEALAAKADLVDGVVSLAQLPDFAGAPAVQDLANRVTAVEDFVGAVDAELAAALADPATAVAATAIANGRLIDGSLGDFPAVQLRVITTDPQLVDAPDGTLFARVTPIPQVAFADFDPVHSFHAPDLALTLADGAPVAAWPNDGTADAAVQATPANQPLIAYTALNGHPAVVGDGVNDVLKTPSVFPIIIPALTVFAVFKMAGDGTVYGGATNTLSETVKQQLYRANGNMSARAGLILPAGPLALNVVHYLAVEYNGPESRVWLDNVLVAEGDTGALPTAHMISLFADNSTGWSATTLGALHALPKTLTDVAREDLFAVLHGQFDPV